MVTTEDMPRAWLLCRRRKRKTEGAVLLEVNALEECRRLAREIDNRTYRIGTANCLVVTRPRYREVFAAQFRDRVPHHYVAMRLEPLLEANMHERCFNCRVGKGQSYGVECLRRDIEEATENYTREAWVMKVDIRGFFMSVDREMLARIMDLFVRSRYRGADRGDIRWLTRMMCLNLPADDCRRRSPPVLRERLPAHKSLFTCPRGRGVPIGNLYSQLFANWLLTSPDFLLDRRVGSWHGRYVDDIYMVSRDKGTLIEALRSIRLSLARKGLGMNERKTYLQQASKGVTFTGVMVRPHRLRIRRKTTRSLHESVSRLTEEPGAGGLSWERAASVNSYAGMLKGRQDYREGKKALLEAVRSSGGALMTRCGAKGLCLQFSPLTSVKVNRKALTEHDIFRIFAQ